MLTKWITAIGCLFLLAGSTKAQEYRTQEYLDLRYQLNEGEQFSIQQKANEETYLTLNNVPQRTSNQKTTTLLLTVQHMGAGGVATLQAEYKQINLYSNQDNITIAVNTEGSETDIYNQLFKALTGKPFTIQMKTNGEILDIKGMDTIFSQMIAALPGVKEKEKPQLMEFLNNQMGPDQIKANLSLVLPYYPDFKVHTNASWSSHLQTKGFYNGRIDNYWKLTFGTKYMIKLENKGLFGTDASQVVDLGSELEGRMQLDGQITGQYIIDPATAWPTRSILHSELKGDFTYFLKKRKKKKGELKAPVRVVRDASFEIKHL